MKYHYVMAPYYHKTTHLYIIKELIIYFHNKGSRITMKESQLFLNRQIKLPIFK